MHFAKRDVMHMHWNWQRQRHIWSCGLQDIGEIELSLWWFGLLYSGRHLSSSLIHHYCHDFYTNSTFHRGSGRSIILLYFQGNIFKEIFDLNESKRFSFQKQLICNC